MDVKTAQNEIAKILCELEKSYGSVVKDIRLYQIEVTANTHQRRHFLTTVQIEIERLPAHDWQTGENT